jgi:hypothetical protein
MNHISSTDKIVYAIAPSTERQPNSRIYHIRPAVQRPDGKYNFVHAATKYRTAGEISTDSIPENTRFIESLDNLVADIEALRPDVPSAVLAVVTVDRAWPLFYWMPVDELGKVRVYRVPAGSVCSRELRTIELPVDGDMFGDGNGHYDGATWTATCHWDAGSAVKDLVKLLGEVTTSIKESVASLEREENAAAAHGKAVLDKLNKFQAKQKATRNKEAALDAKWSQLSVKEKEAILNPGKPAKKR